jgi:hypothetical protein
VTSIGARTFQGCSGLTNVAIPSGVTTIGAQTFQGCSTLGNIIIPLGVTVLGNETFQGAVSLLSAEFLGQVTTVGDRVFQGCTTLKQIVFPESLTSLGTATFKDCTSLQNVVFPQSLLAISGTTTLAGATGVRTLKVPEDLWKTAIKPSLAQNPAYAQLVQFYGDTEILQTLGTQLTYWDGLEGVNSANAEGYQDVVDYYSRKDNYSVDYSSGTSALVKFGGSTTSLTYDVSTGTLSGLGTYDGALTIVGSGGELTQTIVDAAIAAHTVAQNGVVPLLTLTVGPTFTSLEVSLSLQGSGITKLLFPAESPITTTGAFVLAIDSTLAKTVVLPRWVVQQGPWSLV